jgi:hypothetical protein
VGLVRENPLLCLNDIVSAFRRRRGITVSSPTVRKRLLDAAVHRSRPSRAATAESSGDRRAVDTEPAPRQYGYGEAHRDPGDVVRRPCGLTDSEWEQVEPI